MIPTLSRYSPTTPQLALTPTNNKIIANQSPHQRSGFSILEVRKALLTLNDYLLKYKSPVNGISDLTKSEAKDLAKSGAEVLATLKRLDFYGGILKNPEFMGKDQSSQHAFLQSQLPADLSPKEKKRRIQALTTFQRETRSWFPDNRKRDPSYRQLLAVIAEVKTNLIKQLFQPDSHTLSSLEKLHFNDTFRTSSDLRLAQFSKVLDVINDIRAAIPDDSMFD
jgi:hypothetical protein